MPSNWLLTLSRLVRCVCFCPVGFRPIISHCQDASDIERRVQEVKDRVSNLMIGIVNSVTAKDEDVSKESMLEAIKEVEQDIENLMR